MESKLRLVTKLPLDEISNEDGALLVSSSGEYLDRDAVKALLQRVAAVFVVAGVVQPLVRVDRADCFDFCKREVRPRLADPGDEPVDLKAFPGLYAHLARRWTMKRADTIVVLERLH